LLSQLGNNTEDAFTGSPTDRSGNPLDTPEYFVRNRSHVAFDKRRANKSLDASGGGVFLN
jgi:hypothetical protein